MKKVFISLLALGVAGFVLGKTGVFSGNCSGQAANAESLLNNSSDADPDSAANEGKGFAVVELFTSEGCSSCPAADALLGKLAGEKEKDVYVLSYHVDYWDRLGWKDVFSKHEWTVRQGNYVNQFHLESAYTPQVVVNGREEFVGSNNSKLYTAVANGLKEGGADQVKVSAISKEGKINVSYDGAPVGNATINLALVQLKTATEVKRGENGGRRLEHTNVVRDLAIVTATQSKGGISFVAPDGFNTAGFKIIAFIQSKKDLKITAATEAAIQ